jgi:hypothetical protein
MWIVGFPDGTRVRASSISDRCADDPERAFGLYLDARWEPTWPATLIDWEDFGLPEDPELAAQQIVGRSDEGETAASSRSAAWAEAVAPEPYWRAWPSSRACRRRRPLRGSALPIGRKP